MTILDINDISKPQPIGQLDTRGNIYISDKQWDVFVLRYTDPDPPTPTA